MSTSKPIEILNLVNNVCHGAVHLRFNFSITKDAKLMLVRLTTDKSQQDGEKSDCTPKGKGLEKEFTNSYENLRKRFKEANEGTSTFIKQDSWFRFDVVETSGRVISSDAFELRSRKSDSTSNSGTSSSTSTPPRQVAQEEIKQAVSPSINLFSSETVATSIADAVNKRDELNEGSSSSLPRLNSSPQKAVEVRSTAPISPEKTVSKIEGQVPLPNPYVPKKDEILDCLCSMASWNEGTNQFDYKEIKSKALSQKECKVLRLFREYKNMFLKVEYSIPRDFNRNTSQSTMIEKQWRKDLIDGINFQGNHYHGLAFSNSGQKSGSVLFVNKNSEYGREYIYQLLGDFTDLNKMKTVGKLAKRVGAPFGTTKVLPVRILEHDYAEIPEIETEDKEYKISDGCGLISSSKMDELLQPLYPEAYGKISAIQIRFLGYKGLLVRYPDTFVKELAAKHNCKNADKVKILFRPSMNKFNVAHKELYEYMDLCAISKNLEAKYSRQVISVLEYNMLKSGGKEYSSEQEMLKNHEEKHEFVYDTMCKLVNKEIEAQERYLHSCHHALRLFTDEQPIHTALRYALLSSGEAKDILKEPFIYENIFKSVFKNFWGQLAEGKVRIGDPQMVYLMGAVDETNSLKADEVYVSFGSEKTATVLTQTILIGKHPCLMASDIRKVKAVRCAALSHLRNVVIFPSKHNGRPLADQCSGADFDGDCFFIIHNPNIVEDFKQEDQVCAYGDKLREELKQNGEKLKETKNDPTKTIAERIFDHLIDYTKHSQLGIFEYSAKIHYEQNRDMKDEKYELYAKKCALELEGCLFANKSEFVGIKQEAIDGNWLQFKNSAKECKSFDDHLKLVKSFDFKNQSGNKKASLNDVIFKQLLLFLQDIAKQFGSMNSKNTTFITAEDCRNFYGELYESHHVKYEKEAVQCLKTYNTNLAKQIKQQKEENEQEDFYYETEREVHDAFQLQQEQEELKNKKFDYSYNHLFPPNSIERTMREQHFNKPDESEEERKLKAAMFYLHTVAQRTDGCYIMPWRICFDYLVQARIDIENKKSAGPQGCILPLVFAPNHIDLITKRR